MAESQRGDLLGVAEPVLLGAGVQVLHYHQAAAGVGKEACSREGAPELVCVALSSSLQVLGWERGGQCPWSLPVSGLQITLARPFPL